MINFLLKHPEVIENCKDGSINARIMTKFFDSLTSIRDFNADLTKIHILAEGAVGPEVGTLFTTFIHNKLDKLPSPKDMFEMKKEDILKELRLLLKSGAQYRADIAHILGTRLMNYCQTYAENNTVTDAMQARVEAILAPDDIFQNDIKQVVLRKIGTNPKFRKILSGDLIKKFLN